MEDYLFDLNGFLILKDVVSQGHIAELNAIVDRYQDMKPQEWRGRIHVREKGGRESFNLRNICEAGEPFERLIDHPAWIEQVRSYVGGDGLCLGQHWVMLREKGDGGGLHSGAHKRRIRTQFRYHNGFFRCGQINILLALRDMDVEDGPTMVIPGSHKSNIIHPAFNEGIRRMDLVEGTIPAPLKAGDALLFVDALAHGSGPKKTTETRRIMVFRYGPRWNTNPYGYEPSSELLSRLTPERRKIIQPKPPNLPPEEMTARGLPVAAAG